MPLSNATVRHRLRVYLALFLDQNCQYDGYENKACEDLLKQLQVVEPEKEKFNEKHPDHGEKNKP